MNKLLAKLPPFVLPFVTRSLRGGRGQRYVLFSLLLAGATVLFGLWLALGSGGFGQNLRVGVGLERDEWTRENQEFVVFTHDSRAQRSAEREAAELREAGPDGELRHAFGEVQAIVDNGRALVEQAAWSGNRLLGEREELRDRARAVVGLRADDGNGYTHFAWDDPQKVETLRLVLDRGGIPEVHAYESPLGLRDAIMVVGFLAALVLAAAMTVAAPLLVGVQQAQEQHENTLMPLTGTGLDARRLALGLAAGPGFVVGIFAAPQLVIFGLCAALVGDGIAALGTLVALASSALFVTFAAQLLGHLTGSKRTPGLVAIALLLVLGFSWLAGAGMAVELDRDIAGFAAVLPTMGLSVMLGKTFGAFATAQADTTMLATLAWSAAALVFSSLLLTVLTRKLEGRQGAPLAFAGALVGAVTCIGLIHIAMPDFGYSDAPARMYIGLAGLSLPFTALLMGRVPTGDNPAKTRRIPVVKLLLEFGGWGALHIIVCATLFYFQPDALHPIALLWLAWCVGVLGLMAIRTVSLPSSIATHLFMGFCGGSLLLGFGQAMAWGLNGYSQRHVFVLFELGAIAGLMQLALTIGVPALLLRNLRKNLGALR